jgi:hypothetical protein
VGDLRRLIFKIDAKKPKPRQGRYLMMKRRGVNWFERRSALSYPRIDEPFFKAVWSMVPKGVQLVEILEEEIKGVKYHFLVGWMKGLEVGKPK